MLAFTETIRDQYGRAVSGAQVYIYAPNPTFSNVELATLTVDGTAPLDNPLTTDEYGELEFYADAGAYRMDVWVGGKRVWSELIEVGTDLPLDDGVVLALGGPGGAAIIGTEAGETQAALNARSLNYATRAAAAAAGVPVVVQSFRTLGYASEGDGGAATYKRVGSEPSHEGKVQTADGAWWEFADIELPVEALGAVGDDATDDTTAINNAAFAAAALGVRLKFLGSKTYAVSGSLVFAAGSHLVTNGCVFDCSASPGDTTPALTVSGPAKFDELRVNIPTGAARRRGLLLDASGGKIEGQVAECVSVDQQGYSSTSDYGINLTGASDSSIGALRVQNFDLGIIITDAEDAVIGQVEIESYSRGLWVPDFKRLTILRGYVHTRSPNAVSMTPGFNGVLTTDDAAGDDLELTFMDFVVEDAAEHGWRTGGAPQYDVNFVRCVARGCEGTGFKALGTDNTAPTDYHKGPRWFDCIVEDCGSGGASGTNLCGFLVERTDYAKLVRPVVRKKDNANSAVYGINLYGVTNIEIIDPDIRDCQFHGIYAVSSDSGKAVAGISNVAIRGGRITGCQDAIYLNPTASATFDNITIDGVRCVDNVKRGLVCATATGGTFTDCSFRGKLLDNQLDAMVLTASGWCLDVEGDATQGSGTNTLASFAARNGSIWRDPVAGSVSIRKAGAWTAL